ncbi:MAG TPA: NAD-dependent epimerase/dehydratase family protein, partial [Gaiellaceae bacterium]|nr:NAD-dependent epimerase/dehydratase family protein [Gaiellaceae bacterium]
SGNIGTSLLQALAGEPAVDAVLGVSRRIPELDFPRTEWASADVRDGDLASLFSGADAVVHLAWAIQPSRDEPALRSTNVEGSRRVFAAAARAGVGTLVHGSSVGAYSAGPKDRRVDETWPAGGIPSSFYGRHKAEAERLLDDFEREQPAVRTVRMRPGLVFKRGAASGIRRLFLGPFLPSPLLRRALVPLVPSTPRLRFQAVHSLDVGDAYRRAVVGDARGAFNVAADPVLDGRELARLAGARTVPVSARALRRAVELSWRLHLQPSPPGWVDLALGVPLMDCGRARAELGWGPRTSASDALRELLEGMRERAGAGTPPLAPETGGPLRAGELRSGVGEREG